MNQLILPQVYDYHCFYRRALGPVLIHFLKRLKRTTKKQTKFQLKLARKRCQNRQAIFWPSKYIRLRLLQTAIMYYVAIH